MQGGIKPLRGEGSTCAGHCGARTAPLAGVAPAPPPSSAAAAAPAPAPAAPAAAPTNMGPHHRRRPQPTRRRAPAPAAAGPQRGPSAPEVPPPPSNGSIADPLVAPAAAAATALAGAIAPGAAAAAAAAPATAATAAPSPPPPPPDRRPVAVCRTVTLPAQPDLPSAAALLRRALRSSDLARELGGAGAASGLLRLEVALPRGSPPSALRWLRGQQERQQQQQGQVPPLCLYFSGRHSTGPPSTPGAALAEAGCRGWLALAGVGAAWLWRGEAGDRPSAAVRGAGRFLSEAQPRVRVLGGARFDGTGVAAAGTGAHGGGNGDGQGAAAAAKAFSPEWRPFGAYTFAIPSVELTEALEANILAVTVAWDGRMQQQQLQQQPAAAAGPLSPLPSSSSSSAPNLRESLAAFGCGPSTLEDAVEAALRALEGLAPPAGAAAPAPAPALGPPSHSPTREQWGAVVAGVVGRLGVMRGGAQEQQRRQLEQQQQQQQQQQEQQKRKGRRGRQAAAAAGGTGGGAASAPAAAAASAAAAAATADLARSEFMAGGQPSLDALLAAIDAAGSDTSSPSSDTSEIWGSGGGGDYGNGSGGDGGGAPLATAAGSAAAALMARPLSPLPEPSTPDAQLTKIVLARRSTFDLGPAPSSSSSPSSSSLSPPPPGLLLTPPPSPPPLRPLELLEALQERDPHSYQICVALPPPAAHPPSQASGPCFVACTPERLYVRTGARAASEAVAGTRPRGPPGDVEADFFLGLELLSSAKDHDEFSSVRGAVRAALADLGADVAVEVAKSVIKQGGVQHLYARVAAALPRSAGGAAGAGAGGGGGGGGGGGAVGDAQLLAALHPTPAVCGRPRAAALAHLRETEPFDRGFYAGPFGWVSGASSEFVVAIRSALFVEEAAAEEGEGEREDGGGGGGGGGPLSSPRPSSRRRRRLMHAYTGVGIVRGSSPDSEWAELDLKLRQVTAGALLLGAAAGAAAAAAPSAAAATTTATALSPLLHPAPVAPIPPPLSRFHALPNANACWASLIVEELCRLGVSTFAVAPGSRSSPLALAAARHPRARLRVGLDERSLGFWAVGFGRASRQPVAVVTSSGTAVANLLPAAVEAAQSHVPLLLLTADRPSELRGTGANQTIDQVGIFGSYARWSHDLAPPSAEVPGRSALSVVDLAVRAALGGGAGGAAWGAGASAGVGPPGPVHLNVQLREPLVPSPVAWDPRAMMAGLDRWLASGEPLTSAVGLPSLAAAAGNAAALAVSSSSSSSPVLSALRGARRGLLVVGELPTAQDARAAAALARLLGWPVAADVLSGMRVGARRGDDGCGGGRSFSSSPSSLLAPPALLSHFDHVLLPPPGSSSADAWWDALRPDVVLQLGARLTSKRLGQFLERAALAPAAEAVPPPSSPFPAAHGAAAAAAAPPALWIHVAPHAERHDPAFLVTHRVVASPQDLCAALEGAAAAASDEGLPSSSGGSSGGGAAPLSEYARLLAALDRAAAAAIDSELAEMAAGWADEAEAALEAAAAAAAGATSSSPALPPPPSSRGAPILSEAHIARVVSAELPPGHGLYLGNSMPIRDMDMFAAPRPAGVAPGGGAAMAVAAAAAAVTAPPQAASPAATASSFDEDDLARADSDAEMLAALTRGSSSTTSSRSRSRPAVVPSSSSSPPPTPSSLPAAAAPPPPPAAAAPFAGAPVGANRGASGIDGVLSSAAGFAAGLRSPATLLVGDLSFLHDTNGLALLRGSGGAGGDGDAPLTAVVVNNGGGGIFSFLPVASAVDRESFERLWATPQHADLGALCRAHGVPHQRVGWSGGGGGGAAGRGAARRGGDAAGAAAVGAAASPSALSAALAAAWGLGRHSVIEVFPTATRAGNVELHRRVQRRVARAVQAVHEALVVSSTAAGEGLHPALLLAPPLRVRSASVSRYELPLAWPLTTGADAGVRRGALLRIELEEEAYGGGGAAAPVAAAVFAGVGDAAPLPGLHRETFEQACAQLELLAASLPGAPVPREAGALLPYAPASSPSSLEGWLRGAAAVLPPAAAAAPATGAPPAPPFSSLSPSSSSSSSSSSAAPRLLPSVAFALEGALLTALAAARAGSGGGPDVAAMLTPRQQQAPGAAAAAAARGPLVCALLSPRPGSSPEAVAAEAAALLAATGADALKVKVGRPGSDPAAEGAALGAVRRAVGPHPAIRADANRAWSLRDAARFCRAARDAGAALEYLEEPTRAGPGQWRALRRRVEADGNGPAPLLAADESMDDGALEAAWRGEFFVEGGVCSSYFLIEGAGLERDGDGWLSSQDEEDDEDEDEQGEEDGDGAGRWRGDLSLSPLLPGDVAAVVLKPSALGGVSAAWRAARRARLEHGVGKAVVSSAFESAAGVALLAHLAAALDAEGAPEGAGAAGVVPPAPAHGLGTLEWFREDVVPPPSSGAAAAAASTPLPLEPVAGGSAGMSLARASAVLCEVAAAAATGGGGGNNGGRGGGGGDAPAPRVRTWLPRVSERVMRCEADGRAHDVRAVEVLPPLLGGVGESSDGNGDGDNAGAPCGRRPVVLLHGFLGDAAEWLPLARALASAGHPCLALDLPGHGRTRPAGPDGGDHSLPAAALLAREAAGRWLGFSSSSSSSPSSSFSPPSSSAAAPLLVGYSLGGRVALQALADMAESGRWAAGVALLSASPGIRAEDQRRQRAARDDELAGTLERGGLPAFVDAWYEGPLWAPLRRHGAFSRVKARRRGDGGEGGGESGRGVRTGGADAAELARALRGMSAGRMAPLWREASSSPALAVPMLLVAGAEDGKFVSIHRQLAAARRRSAAAAAATTAAATGAPTAAANGAARAAASPPAAPDSVVEVPGAGHSVHLEAPTAVLDALSAFLARLQEEEEGEEERC